MHKASGAGADARAETTVPKKDGVFVVAPQAFLTVEVNYATGFAVSI